MVIKEKYPGIMIYMTLLLLGKLSDLFSLFKILKYEYSICIKSEHFLARPHVQLSGKSSSIGESELTCIVN